MMPSKTLYNVSNRRSVREPISSHRRDIECLIALNNGVTKHLLIAELYSVLTNVAGSLDPIK